VLHRVGLVVCFLSLGRIASATPIDASFIPTLRNAVAEAGGGTMYGQTFTVGTSGFLTEVDLFTPLDFAQSVDIDILPTFRIDSTYFPDRDFLETLGHTSVTSTPTLTEFGFLPIDLSALDISVSAGQVLTIVARSDTSFAWYGDSGGLPYPGGSMWSGADPGFLSSGDSSVALGFRIHVADSEPTPVPEPPSVALLATVLVACAWRRIHPTLPRS
jgi:hypothetical protein